MREWTIAVLWAAATAAVVAWIRPDHGSLPEFLRMTATLVPPIWLAVRLEQGTGGCRLRGLFS